MPTDAIHLIGAGGHGRVVADALMAAGIGRAAIVVRDGRPGLIVLGRSVATPEVTAGMAGERFHVAIGSAILRARLHHAARDAGAIPLTVVHPAAVVSAAATLGDAVLVAATAVVAPDAQVGEGTIVNHGAMVDHDVRTGSFCHIAPHATLGGGVTIGDRTMIGAGAVVLPGIAIGADVTIGAGAVVIRPIDVPGTWAGNPARRLDR